MSTPTQSFPPSGPPSTLTNSPSPTSTSGSSGSSTDATLYLYTFLATLVLLLAISSAIVIRSLVLRRRHQRLVEEAIRTGSWTPHRLDTTTGRRRRDIGQKPKLWEARVHPEDDGESEENEKSKWIDIMPVYAAYVNAPASSPQGPVSGSAENSMDPSSRPPRFIRPFQRKRSPPAPQSSDVPPTDGQALSSLSSSPTSTPTPAVRVAVLIAMPSPSHKHVSNDENGPPVVEIGVIEASVKNAETATPTRDAS